VTGVDHIGIAVKSIAEALPLWRDALGMELLGIEVVPSEKVRVAILKSKGPGGARVELLEPTGPDSPIAKHLEKRGPGIHHVALEVDDLAARMAALKRAGTPAMDESPRPGAEGAKVTFLHPKHAGGVLVELTQRPPGAGPH
jgi:methylmalonyl-CoA epimerase